MSTARTGFAQSYVSATVARLRAKGWVETSVDPRDRRRTLVRLPDAMVRAIHQREGRSLDGALAAALPHLDAAARAEVLSMLDALARRLRPNAGEPKDADCYHAGGETEGDAVLYSGARKRPVLPRGR